MSATRARAAPAGEAGQGSVELVALAPMVAALALVAGQLLAAGAARELAGHAAQAGAVALLQGDDPRAAARAAVPGWTHGRIRVQVEGARVRVLLRPRAAMPALAELLEAKGEAHAGARAR